MSITPMSTGLAARWFGLWATRVGSRPSCRRPMAGSRKNSTCARFAPRVRFSPGTTASPILRSPCRAWAPPRYRCSAAMRSKPNICRRCATAVISRHLRSRNPKRAPTSARWRRPRPRTGRRTCASTGSRPGSPMAASRTTTSCSRAPARRPAPRGFPVSSSTPIRRVLRLPAASRSSLHIRSRRFASPAAASRWPIVSAAPAKASRLRWRRSISSARPSPPRRSGWRAAPSTK